MKGLWFFRWYYIGYEVISDEKELGGSEFMSESGVVGEKDIFKMEGSDSSGEAGVGVREVGEGVENGIWWWVLGEEDGIFFG